MLDQLREYLESPDRDDDPFVRLDSFVLDGHDASLIVRIMNYDADETWKIWEVRALGLRDFCVREPHGDLTIHQDHVLARQHTDCCVDLCFRGKPRSSAEIVGHLYRAHRQLVADWIPFDRYMNNQVDLEALIDGGYGKLADGPEFLVSAYAGVLKDGGISPSLLPPRPAKWFDGRNWIETEARLSTLVIGDSFYVAAAFDESPA
jgi:hypothetical protein